MKGQLRVMHAATTLTAVAPALQDLREQLAVADRVPAAVLFFCSPKYDRDELGRALASSFPCAVSGCTTSGQIGPRGFQPTGITAAALYSDDLSVRTYLVDLKAPVRETAVAVGARARAELTRGKKSFALLLVDAMPMVEECLTATLYEALEGIPLVGGSAGDDLAFQATYVYHGGQFHRDAAVLTVVETSLGFVPFKFQHFVPTSTRLVITGAFPERRVVTEINGLPAAEAYAAALDIAVDDLTSEVFSRHPLLLRSGGQHWVRSIQKVAPDRWMTFFCAIEEGLVVAIGEAVDALETASRAFAEAAASIGSPELVIGCDCILRRLEIEQTGAALTIGDLYARNRVIGFSTYGEQFNGMHINQTFTGIALGR